MANNPLDQADQALWQKVTETVTPSRGQMARRARLTQTETPITPAVKINPKKPKPIVTVETPRKKPKGLTPADLDHHGYGGISRASARSMKSGQAGFSKKIDLHGLTLADAHQRLLSFLLAAAADGHRHVLVITGKGLANKGKIRSHLPVWLNEPPLSAHVIAYCQAQIKDGGAGAWYVNLRRRG